MGKPFENPSEKRKLAAANFCGRFYALKAIVFTVFGRWKLEVYYEQKTESV